MLWSESKSKSMSENESDRDSESVSKSKSMRESESECESDIKKERKIGREINNVSNIWENTIAMTITGHHISSDIKSHRTDILPQNTSKYF